MRVRCAGGKVVGYIGGDIVGGSARAYCGEAGRHEGSARSGAQSLFQGQGGIRALVRSRGLGDVYEGQIGNTAEQKPKKC